MAAIEITAATDLPDTLVNIITDMLPPSVPYDAELHWMLRKCYSKLQWDAIPSHRQDTLIFEADESSTLVAGVDMYSYGY